MACKTQSITVPQDIIIDILYRLPVKTLGRFRCVSKEWLSLLSQNHFINTHLKTLNRNHLIFLSMYGARCRSVPFDDLESVSELPMLPFESTTGSNILCSCNGLVLAEGWSGFIKDFAVFNLTTKEYVKFEKVISHALTYNNTSYYYDFSKEGFGYDSVSDDYKVVSMSYFLCWSAIPPFKIRVHVYSLRSVTWKQVSDPPYDHYGWRDCIRDWQSGVFVNGFIHWIASKGSDSIQVIAAFSLAEEKFISEVPSPDLFNDVDILSDKDCKLVALGEKLAIFNSVKGDVWLMNEYGVQKSWTKIVAGGYYGFLMDEPNVFYDNGKIMIEALRQVWMYDLEEQTFGKTDDFKILNPRRFISTCVESLVSPILADPIRYRQLQTEDGGGE